ncbi:MAG TPA: septal ring lytic transglycosylase RlpA family protein [Devosia sp.]|nr:septal ring lytic transglycosylase RlpA family protein [Devosia sp.]
MVLRSRIWRVFALLVVFAPMLAACSGGVGSSGVSRSAFTSKEFGVSVSPRVTKAKFPKRGGGRIMSAKPYVVRGVTYRPVAGPGYVERGESSWYGQDFHGRRTANGEIFGAYYLTAASPVLPIPSYARIVNLENGRSVMVRINDRGPYMQGRIVDVSYQAAEILGFRAKGSAQVEVRYVAPAPLNIDDSKMLMASVNRLTKLEQQQADQPVWQVPEIVMASAERVNLGDVVAPWPASRNPFSGGLVGDIFINGLAYAEPGSSDAAVNGAVEAATAMATRSPQLADWVAAVDEDARRLKLQLGLFGDPEGAAEVATRFALLGAVDEEEVALGDRRATRLTLTMLKPGVARADVVALARELGLADLVLY